MHLLELCTNWKKDSNNVLVNQVKEKKNTDKEEHVQVYFKILFSCS